MLEKLNHAVANFVTALLWCGGVAAFLGLNVFAAFENYQQFHNAFELLGYNSVPLSLDPLFGWLAGALLPDLNLAVTNALMAALCLSVGTFLFVHVLVGIYSLAQQTHLHHRAGNHEDVRALLWETGARLAFLSVVGAGVFRIVIGVAKLYRYRSFCDAMGFTDPQVAVSQVPVWDQAVSIHGGLFAVDIANYAPWMFIGLTAVAAMSLEWSLLRASKRFDLAFRSLASLARPAEPEAQVYGFDEYGAPVHDPAAPVAYDEHGDPVTATDDSGLFVPAAGVGAACDAPPADDDPPADGVIDGGEPEDDQPPVVDPATGRRWSRRLWKRLHGRED